MNPQLNLHYRHSDQSRVFRDVRRKPVPDIAQDQCYFLGFRIAIAHDYRYEHALIVADDHDSLIQGIRAEINAIQGRSSAAYASDIAVVFVRSLLMHDPAISSTVERLNMKAESREVLSRRDDNQFTLLHRRQDRFRLAAIKTSDALAAIQHAHKSDQLAGNDFKPLEVCQAHPVTTEFEALFQSTAKRIQCLIGSMPVEGGLLH
ncbi:MAG: hypothetical protein WBM09_11675 [Gallionella sp.]